MSLYSFATANLTTHADHKRRPAVNKGQVTRTLILCVLFLAALTLIARRTDTEDASTLASVPLPACVSGVQCAFGTIPVAPADEGVKAE